VISGRQYLHPTDKTISVIKFVIDDFVNLFHDFGVFGLVPNAKDHIQTIVGQSARNIKIGQHPEIVYFAGRREIFKTDTTIGYVSAEHNPVVTMGGPRGVLINNTVFIKLCFIAPVNFDTAFNGLLSLVRFFELVVGRQQNFVDIGPVTGDGASPDHYLNVDCPMAKASLTALQLSVDVALSHQAGLI
jgi:hypothetical protein